MGRAMPGSIVNGREFEDDEDRKSTRLNSSHGYISYAVFCLKKKKKRSSEITDIYSSTSRITTLRLLDDDPSAVTSLMTYCSLSIIHRLSCLHLRHVARPQN